MLFAKVSGRYDRDELVLRKSTLEELPALLGLAGAYALAWSLLTYAAGVPSIVGGVGVTLLWGWTAATLILARAGARRVVQLAAPVARLRVVGFLLLEDERALESDWGERSRRRRQHSFDDLAALVREREVHRVFLIPTNADGETMLDAVRQTTALGIKVSIVPRLFEVVGSAVAFDTVGGVTRPRAAPTGSQSLLTCAQTPDGHHRLRGLPLIALVAAAIKLDSPGPVFFRQRRVGRAGEVFEIVKFRSMIDGAEAARGELDALNETSGNFKLTIDPRVTRVGRLLRRSSIDELPQLINVLRGEISLVGPRPLILDEDRLIEGRHRELLHLACGPSPISPRGAASESRPSVPSHFTLTVKESTAGPQLLLNLPVTFCPKLIVPLAALALVKLPLTFDVVFVVLPKAV